MIIIMITLIIRPVVAFQTNSFLRARPKSSTFVSRLAQTQVLYRMIMIIMMIMRS